jgi:hypothetical protein
MKIKRYCPEIIYGLAMAATVVLFYFEITFFMLYFNPEIIKLNLEHKVNSSLGIQHIFFY